MYANLNANNRIKGLDGKYVADLIEHVYKTIGPAQMKDEAKMLLNKHAKLVHSEMMKVTSHVQRDADEWIVNTIMIEGCDVPFKYKRKKKYKDLKGACVNMTYYPAVEIVAGIEMEIMNVVRIKVS